MIARLGRLEFTVTRHGGSFPRLRLQLVIGDLVFGLGAQGKWWPGYDDLETPFAMIYLGAWEFTAGLLVPRESA